MTKKRIKRPVRKKELADEMGVSVPTLNRYSKIGRIARPALRYSKRMLFYTAWQANEILAGRTGEIIECQEQN